MRRLSMESSTARSRGWPFKVVASDIMTVLLFVFLGIWYLFFEVVVVKLLTMKRVDCCGCVCVKAVRVNLQKGRINLCWLIERVSDSRFGNNVKGARDEG